MPNETLVSIVIPCYNIEHCLPSCLRTVASQTHKNIQIICVDDESTDGSADVVRSFMSKDPRFSLVQIEHGGLSQARNAGLDACTGDYILLVDGDDAISPETVEVLLNEAFESGSDITMCGYVGFERDEELTLEAKRESGPTIRRSGVDAYKRSFQGLYTQMNVAWGKLYRASLFSGIRYPVGKIHEDEFVTYKLFLRSSKVSVLDCPLVFYRQRSGSIMKQALSQRNLVALDAFQERLESFLEIGDKELIIYAANYYIAYISWFYSDFESPEIRQQLVARYKEAFKKYKGCLPFGLRMKRRLFLLSPALFAKLYQMAEERSS